MLGSHTLRVDWYHRRAALMTAEMLLIVFRYFLTSAPGDAAIARIRVLFLSPPPSDIEEAKQNAALVSGWAFATPFPDLRTIGL